MKNISIPLSPDKKIYFASDFHLGVPGLSSSHEREKKIVQWLEFISKDAQAIFLLGDIFDFWFEYRSVVPKGFVRILGKLAEIADKGIPIYQFTGNHDMWMFDYLQEEINLIIHREPVQLTVGDTLFHIGHGDGLGPGDHTYKFLKKIFSNPFFQWLFSIAPPVIGMGIAHRWSGHSRIQNIAKQKELEHENEWLVQYCKEIEQEIHHDYYIFGHRHLLMDLAIHEQSRYINLGEWVTQSPFAVFNGEKLELKQFQY